MIFESFLLDIYCFKEFEESGDPERHFQALLSLAKEGVEKGKVQTLSKTIFDGFQLEKVV